MEGMRQEKGEWDSEKTAGGRVFPSGSAGTEAADETMGWRCQFWCTTWWAASSGHVFCCIRHCVLIFCLRSNIFLTYLDNLFHRHMLTWGSLVLGMGAPGLELVDWAGAGQSWCIASSLPPMSLQYAWCVAMGALQHSANMGLSSGPAGWSGSTLKSGTARWVRTPTRTSTPLSLGMRHWFHIELQDGRAQICHLVYLHAPA